MRKLERKISNTSAGETNAVAPAEIAPSVPVKPPAPEVEPSAEDLARASHRDDEQVSRAARPRREPKQASYLPDIHRTLPQSLDAEKGVLCSCLLSPENVLKECMERLTTAHFYQPAHQILFGEMINLVEHERKPLDFITLTQALKDHGNLEKAGGGPSISELFTFVPTSSNADYYLDIVREKYLRRLMIKKNAEFADRAYNEHGDFKPILDEFEVMARELGVDGGNKQTSNVVSFRDLMALDPKSDPDSVLGHRWLCRGGSCLWVGQSGIGKSSIAMQAGLMWAQGLSLWGIAPTGGRRLKSLFIQAENDLGDMAEMCQGVLKRAPRPPGMTEDQFIGEMSQRMVFVRDAVSSGKDFARSAARLIAEHKPDLVWVDPLLSYAGDDISNQKVASNFLRNTLNPIALETGIIWMLLHHTGKPSADPKSKAHWSDHDFSYAAFGSSELVNWARAVNVLRSVKGGRFELRFAKRGRRAGVKVYDEDMVNLDDALEGFGPDQVGAHGSGGEFTDVVYLKHADRGIYWEQIEAPTEDELKPKAKSSGQGGPTKFQEKYPIEELLEKILSNNIGRTPGEMKKWLFDQIGIGHSVFYEKFKVMKASGKLTENKGRWFHV